jgi:membrane protein implicated in regulation of membrane protease activity
MNVAVEAATISVRTFMVWLLGLMWVAVSVETALIGRHCVSRATPPSDELNCRNRL